MPGMATSWQLARKQGSEFYTCKELDVASPQMEEETDPSFEPAERNRDPCQRLGFSLGRHTSDLMTCGTVR